MAKKNSVRHMSNRKYHSTQQVKGYYRNLPINTTLDRRQRKTSSSSSSVSSLSSLSWTENLGSNRSNNQVSLTLSPPSSSIELSLNGRCSSSSSLKSSDITTWNDHMHIDEVKAPVKICRVEFDTPRFSVSKENQLPFLDLNSNRDNWREFKDLKGVCEGNLRARIPLIKILLPINRDLSVGRLYSLNESIQCSVCGVRFPSSEQKTDFALHLDFHYLSKSHLSKKCRSGSWYPSISSLLESDRDFKTDENPNKIFQKKEVDNALPAWKCEIKNCELCLEPFEQEYRHGDLEGWYIINAMHTLSGGMVHPGCQ
ncbi:PCF11 [Lepeophtheirus salmonis]|uniref:PCF11 n=1 Tax=Lepeophtheirus salmonis TaxID=72036 RepID=A0A7R8H9Q4_LEPSM|nr:PCF11 [Lepeophtheirus salmonis]CAF2958176.1 PCF11 [Lepeophtheirus salmonis]